jgi:hypothetical protein
MTTFKRQDGIPLLLEKKYFSKLKLKLQIQIRFPKLAKSHQKRTIATNN